MTLTLKPAKKTFGKTLVSGQFPANISVLAGG